MSRRSGSVAVDARLADEGAVVDVGKELVRRHFDEMWNDRNLDVCDELMAEAFVEHAPAPFSAKKRIELLGVDQYGVDEFFTS